MARSWLVDGCGATAGRLWREICVTAAIEEKPMNGSSPPTLPAVAKTSGDYRCFKISPGDTNRLAILFDPIGDGVDFICTIEIFDVGGKTPPNTHPIGQEMFFILQGECIATADGRPVTLRAGDSLLVRPGNEHVIENTGTGKLYLLQLMVPNDDFAELIRRGTPATLDDEDLAVLRRARSL
jgi:mannose-6-phosphate isomerase-like protein (cupin superfamily)